MAWDRFSPRESTLAPIRDPQPSLFPDVRGSRYGRVYFDYRQWEEFKFGMWRDASPAEVRSLLPKAIEFTGDAPLYGSFMQRVIREWPISCEQNMTCRGMNRHAWVGHAATCLAIGCPEAITREAWHHLTQEQRDAANDQAQLAIEAWEARYRGQAS